MSIVSQKMTRNQVRFLVVVTAIFLVSAPALVLSSHKDKLYVDADASGVEDGSSENPYKTIKKAMDKASGKTEIHVASGNYKENVKMKDDVEIYGESKKGVVIEADDKDDPVVTMKDDTKINKVTLKKGSYGIKVDDDEKASIVECIVRDNKKGGVYIKKDGTKKSAMVSLSKNEIKDNDGPGIYSEKRRLSITDNEIRNNDGDGMDIEAGVKAWIADNEIEDNEKSGMKLRLDRSEIWTKHNKIKNNDREGIEISFKGESGRIDIAKTKITNNGRFGVAKVQRATFAGNVGAWNKYLTFDDRNTIEGNKSGGISPIFIIK